ncbi:XAC2610-related protein [Pantoea dispersa]|uniref:XAC2610-related protein n=1 Tax=Pantoea dispersa TaxID=59814 RepID=UPI0035298E3C
MKYIIFLLCFFTKVAFGCDNDILDVNSAKNISANVFLKDNNSLVVSILDAGKLVNVESIDVSSEKKNHITFEDYNHDGYKDFSIWHLDEGMSTYKIYRLFIFSPAGKKFIEVMSACGDEFVNVRVEEGNLINVINVINDDNAPKSCAMSLKISNKNR